MFVTLLYFRFLRYNTYLYSGLFKLCSNALLKNTAITLQNTHRSYTEKMICGDYGGVRSVWCLGFVHVCISCVWGVCCNVV